MKLSMVAAPPTESRLRALKQLGADYAVHYDMHDLPDDLDELRVIRDRYARFGLPLKVAEAGPAIDRIVLGKEGAAEQIERYKRIVGHLGRLGVEVVAYNFMPQVTCAAVSVSADSDSVALASSEAAASEAGLSGASAASRLRSAAAAEAAAAAALLRLFSTSRECCGRDASPPALALRTNATAIGAETERVSVVGGSAEAAASAPAPTAAGAAAAADELSGGFDEGRCSTSEAARDSPPAAAAAAI